MSTRRGISLIEVVLLLSTSAVVLTMSGQLIHRILHAQSRATALLAVERDALRLAAQFRRDVRHANDAVLDAAASDQRMTLLVSEDQRIEYRLAGGQVRRVLVEGEQAVAQEEFVFSLGTMGAFSELESPRRMALSLETPAVADLDRQQSVLPRYLAPVCLRVEACLGEDLYDAQQPAMSPEEAE